MDDHRPKIVRNSARLAAQRLYDAAIHPDEFPERIPRVLMAAGREGTMMIAALVEALKSENFLQRLTAALQILVSRRSALLEVDDAAIQAAERVYLDGLNDSDTDVRQATLMMMCNAPGTPVVVARLNELRKDADPHSVVFIAAGLWTSGEHEPETTQVLTQALEGDDIVLVRAAALALARNKVMSARALERLMSVFHDADETMKQSLLFAFQELGTLAVLAAPMLAALIGEERTPKATKKIAAIALGSITSGTDKGTASLSKLLKSPDPELVRAALLGLAYARCFSPNVVQRIAALLSSSNSGIRESAAMTLSAAGTHAVESLAALIERVEREGSREVLGFVFDALALIGPPATAELIRIVRQCDRRTHEPAAEALAVIGLDAAMSLIAELEKEVNDGVAVALIVVLEQSAMDLSAAIERIAAILPASKDEQRVLMLMMALEVSRDITAQVVPGIIKWLNTGSDELALWCCRVCVRIGEPAVELLRDALATATPAGTQRITALLIGHEAKPHEDFRDLAQFDQKSLRVFLYVGRYLGKHGPTSVQKIAGGLESMRKSGLIDSDTPTSKRWIQEHLQGIKRQFGVTFGGQGRKYELNQAAADFLVRLERYFAPDAPAH